MGMPQLERWYDIPEYRGRYQVSTHGRVRSLARVDDGGNRRSLRVLRPDSRVNGRRHFLLCKKGVARSFCASVLMARAYRISKPSRCAYVIHRNGDNRDFRRGNLRWATLAELRIHDGSKTSSRFYGVSRLYRSHGVLCWLAALRVDGHRRELGLFATQKEAAYAYDGEVKRLRIKRPLNGLSRPKAYKPKVASLPGEIWRPFPGAQRTHMISNKGRVRTLAHLTRHGQRVVPKLRKIFVGPRGYRTILIRQRRYSIPRTIERAFATESGGVHGGM